MPIYSNFYAATPKITSKLINENAHMWTIKLNQIRPYRKLVTRLSNISRKYDNFFWELILHFSYKLSKKERKFQLNPPSIAAPTSPTDPKKNLFGLPSQFNQNNYAHIWTSFTVFIQQFSFYFIQYIIMINE